MLIQLLLPIAQYIVEWALEKANMEDELEDAIVVILVKILEKAVKMTKTDVDDKILDLVKVALKPSTKEEPMVVEFDEPTFEIES